MENLRTLRRLSKVGLVAAALVVVATVGARTAGAGVINISADDSSWNRANNTGASSQPNTLAGNNGSSGPLRGLYTFDLAALEAAAGGQPVAVNSVALTMIANNNSAGIAAGDSEWFDLVLSTSSPLIDQTYAQLGWDTNPSAGFAGVLSSFEVTAPVATNDTLVFGSTSAFCQAIADIANDPANSRVNAVVKHQSETTAEQAFLRLYGYASYNPATTMVIDYSIVPEPATMVVLAMGGGALLVLRRRRRN